MERKAKKVKKALSLIMALVITFTSLNLTDVAKINAQAEEIGEDVSYSVSDGDIKDDVIVEESEEEAKKNVPYLVTGLYMADLFNFNNDRHPYAFGDYRSEGWGYEEFTKTYSPQRAKTISHYAFRFYDDQTDTFTALTMADLTVSKSDSDANDFVDDNFTLLYSLDGVDNNNYEIYELYHNVECTYTISYTYQGTPYSVEVVVGLPDVAFYSSNTRDVNSLIDGDFYYSNKNNKIYLLTDGNKPASAYSFDYEINWNVIPAGDETKYVSVSSDNSEITLKPGCAGLKIGIVEKSSGNEIWSVFIEEAPTSGLRFMNEIDWRRDFDENIDVIEIWENDELDKTYYERILPNSQNIYIFGYYDVDNDTYAPISLEDTNVSFNGCADYFEDTNCTVNYKGNDYKVYNFETRTLGEYIVSYYDGSDTSSVKINIVLPEIGFYKTDVRSQENVLFLSDFRYDKKSSEPQNVYVLTDSYTNIDDYYYELRWQDEFGEHEIKEGNPDFYDYVEVNATRNILTIKASAVNKGLRIKKDFEDGGSYFAHEIYINKIEYADSLLVTSVEYNDSFDEDSKYYFREDSMFSENIGFGVDEFHYIVFGCQTGEYDEMYNPVIDNYYRLSDSDLGKLSVKAFTKDILYEDGTSAGREELETDVTLRNVSYSINYSNDSNMEGLYNGDYAVFELVGALENCEYEVTYDPDGVPGSGDELTVSIYIGYP